MEKYFIITIVEAYDGLEFRSQHLVRGNDKHYWEYLEGEALEFFGHEDTGSDTVVEHVKEITKEEFDIAHKVLNSYA